MTPGPLGAVAQALGASAAGSFVGRVCAPGRWDLGLELPGGVTLGLCWEPSSPAVGLCSWAWPRGNPPDVLKGHLKGARIEAVEALAGEPILVMRLRGERARALVWEGLGRSANCLLLGEGDVVLWSGRVLGGPHRSGKPGTTWTPPAPAGVRREREALSDARGYLTEEGPKILLEGLLARGRKAALAALRARERALERRREAVQGDRAEGEGWLELEGLGQALLAAGDLHRRGESGRRVTDYTRSPPSEVDLPLDPALTVLENAQRLFKRAKKGQARLARTSEILAAVEAEKAQLAQRRMAIESWRDLDAFYPAARRTKAGAPARDGRARLPSGVLRLELPGNFAGFAGKSAQGNDAVSFRVGRGEDFWFHAEDYAGCHVVVKNPDRRDSLPLEVERAAALHAAARSAAPAGNRVAVTVARCKNLRSVPGAPGRVWVSKPRTVFVDLPARR